MKKLDHKIRYYPNGNKWYENYYLNNKYHNENGPAYIYYYENGNKMYEMYYLNSKLHNEKGPAQIYYNKNSNIEYERYYLNGEKIYVNSLKELKKYIRMLILKWIN